MASHNIPSSVARVEGGGGGGGGGGGAGAPIIMVEYNIVFPPAIHQESHSVSCLLTNSFV